MQSMMVWALAALASFALAGFRGNNNQPQTRPGKMVGGKPVATQTQTKTITLESSAFKNGQAIPDEYAKQHGMSPPLKWSGVPKEAKELALIMHDPDAPVGDWTHWVIYSIPPQTAGLKEGMPTDPQLDEPQGAKQGVNDYDQHKMVGYGGPQPPSGKHRYFFELYALDTELDLPAKATRQQLEDAMKEHVIARGELMGTYAAQ